MIKQRLEPWQCVAPSFNIATSTSWQIVLSTIRLIIIIDGRYVSNILNICTIRAPYIVSDYYLVVAQVKLSISGMRFMRPNALRKLDVKKLR